MEPGSPGMLDFALGPDFLIVFHLLQIAVLLGLLRYLDIYEREPYPVILALFCWGAVGAVGFALVGNALVEALLSPDVREVYGAAISAPIMEEIGKGLALLVALAVSTWMARHYGTHGFSGVTDGIVYGAAVGLGFAFTENVGYFFFTMLEGGWEFGTEVFLMRVNFSGLAVLGHALYTGLFGAGLGLAVYTANRARRLLYAGGGLALAMLLHAKWNGLAVFLLVREFGFDSVHAAFTNGVPAAEMRAIEEAFETGWALTLVLYYLALAGAGIGFALWLRHERRIIAFELAEEVNAGLLTLEEYQLLPDFRSRTSWYVRLLRAGEFSQYGAVRDLHNQLVRLALIKWKIRRSGSDPTPVQRLRQEVVALRAYAVALARASTPPAGPPVPADPPTQPPASTSAARPSP